MLHGKGGTTSPQPIKSLCMSHFLDLILKASLPRSKTQSWTKAKAFFGLEFFQISNIHV